MNAKLKKKNQQVESLCEYLLKPVSVCVRWRMRDGQYSLKANIEMKNIATREDEDLADVLNSLGEAIREPI